MPSWERGNFNISTDKEKLNSEIIYQFLKQSYWAKERTYKEVIDSIQNSLCFGVYENVSQVGFARVITDYTTFAYLADVFILSTHQGLGLGKWLTDIIFNMEELKNISLWMLLTLDAHKLYERVGFIQFPHPERVMAKKKL